MKTLTIVSLIMASAFGMISARCSFGSQAGCGGSESINKKDFQCCMDRLAKTDHFKKSEASCGSIRCSGLVGYDFKDLRQKLWDQCLSGGRSHHDGQSWCRGIESDIYLRYDKI
ncbi:hypothetical protein RMCBS344292_11155 [Rhizopus microsporus]|nr:hypothetical protein RMCBS344292_11155 [Rhizopus microsporus]